jgi:DNA ligase (NAD+)
MHKQAAQDRILKLRELINDYRYHYHVLNESVMSEAAADSLKHELSQLEEQFPDLITPDSPSQRVAGEPLPGFKQLQHSSRMLSLNDVFDEKELLAWETRINKLLPENTKLEFFADIKMDGLACALIYQDGLLVQGITRGDGFVGEDVTANVRTIESIPLTLRHSDKYAGFLSGRTEIRGEIVMYKQDFEKLNKQREADGKPLFANPRNTAAGTIRQLDPKLVAERPLHFRGYDLQRDNQDEISSYAEAYKIMHALGFLVNAKAPVYSNISDIMQYAHIWEDKRHELPFNTDGLVVKVNQLDIYRQLGVVGKAPRGAVALKYAAEQSTTKVRDIFVSIGRTGAATPVAILEPVQIAGSTIQMATLHNESEIARKDIRVGDSVIVHKAGDIIPEIIEPLKKLRTGQEKPFVMPTNCPDCNTKLIKLKAEDAAWRCPNKACPSRAWKQIEHYASKGAMDIEGLGEKNVVALIDAGYIDNQADIYSITPEMLLKLDRFADVSANKLVVSIQSKKNPPLAKFLYGLGIRHIGTQTAIDLSQHYKSFENIAKATTSELSEIEGIGEIVAESIVEWFSEPSNQKLLENFKKRNVWPKKIEQVGGKLSGQKFVITGSLESMGRDQAADKLRELGATFQSSVGKDTDILVVGSNVGETKLSKARSLGIKQIDESELLKIIGK